MRTIILFLAAASAAFGQLNSNVLTITASRQLNIQPDQVTLTVYVVTDPGQTLDNVLAALQGTKITAADLSNVGTPINTYDSLLQWVFTPTVPFSALNTMTAALGALPANGPISLEAFYVSATASPEAVASQPCPYPALISDAEAQAAKLAAAAGVTVGPIVHLAQGGAQGSTIPVLRYNTSSALYFASASEIVNQLASGLSNSPACTLTVQFKLGQ